MKAIVITKQNFEEEVIKSDKPVLIDFWASWCGPCRMVSPIIEEIANEVSNAKICKINIDDENELAERFAIMSIPTIIVMKNGEVVNKSIGARPKAELLKMLN